MTLYSAIGFWTLCVGGIHLLSRGCRCLERRTAAAANSIPDAAASIAIRMRVYLDLIHLIGLSSLNVGTVYGHSVLIICVKLCK